MGGISSDPEIGGTTDDDSPDSPLGNVDRGNVDELGGGRILPKPIEDCERGGGVALFSGEGFGLDCGGLPFIALGDAVRALDGGGGVGGGVEDVPTLLSTHLPKSLSK